MTERSEPCQISEAAVIFCDDIKREANGKFSLIGTYTNEILVLDSEKELPKLCAIARIVFKDSEKHTVNVSMKYGDNEYKITDVKTPSSEDQRKMHIFVYDIQPFPIDGGGEIVVSLAGDGKSPVVIGELNIKKVEKLPEPDYAFQENL